MVDLDQLLERSSRTFALSIPMLPDPSRRAVTLAYLLFRIADTLEDASEWSRKKKVDELAAFRALLADASRVRTAAERWLSQPPLHHEGYLELLKETPEVFEEFAKLSATVQEIIVAHVCRTVDGMTLVVERTRDDGCLALNTLEDLREYCYFVAGIVGEMLTELYLVDADELAPVAEDLRDRARDFGEGLQLVNILKDSASDATEGRAYLPAGVARSEVFALARRDLERATEYVEALQSAGAQRGVIAFNALPVSLAWATLDVVERDGPGSKITRDTVFEIVAETEQALDSRAPAVIRRVGRVADR